MKEETTTTTTSTDTGTKTTDKQGATNSIADLAKELADKGEVTITGTSRKEIYKTSAALAEAIAKNVKWVRDCVMYDPDTNVFSQLFKTVK